MDVLTERSRHRPMGIFDVRDHYREQQIGDGLAATVSGRVRFAVTAVVTSDARLEPRAWVLDTRRTMSGLSTFLDRVVDEGHPRVVRKLTPDATSVELRVSCPTFQPRNVAFQPGSGRLQIDLEPAVDYPFDRLATRPDQGGPTLIRGTVRDETGRGVPGAAVAVQEGIYVYRTEADGAWVIVLPDDLVWAPVPIGDGTVERLDVEVRITLAPGRTGQTADLLPDPGPAEWRRRGLVLTRTVTAERGTTAPVPDLRLRLS